MSSGVGQIFCGDCAHGLIFTQRREVRKEFFLTAVAQKIFDELTVPEN
jgi:hypothetical protein